MIDDWRGRREGKEGGHIDILIYYLIASDVTLTNFELVVVVLIRRIDDPLSSETGHQDMLKVVFIATGDVESTVMVTTKLLSHPIHQLPQVWHRQKAYWNHKPPKLWPHIYSHRPFRHLAPAAAVRQLPRLHQQWFVFLCRVVAAWEQPWSGYGNASEFHFSISHKLHIYL